jgi:hypothetical protein
MQVISIGSVEETTEVTEKKISLPTQWLWQTGLCSQKNKKIKGKNNDSSKKS